MAKLLAPLHSLGAHGSIDKTLTFSGRKGSEYVRKYNKPLTAPTADQVTRRAAFKAIIAEWNTRTQAEKDGWEDLAPQKRPLTGYNIFLSLPVTKRNVRMFGNAKFGEGYFGGPVPR